MFYHHDLCLCHYNSELKLHVGYSLYDFKTLVHVHVSPKTIYMQSVCMAFSPNITLQFLNQYLKIICICKSQLESVCM